MDKKGRILIPKEFRDKLNINESTPLIIETEEQNMLKIRLIQEEKDDYTSDPLWKVIHDPVFISQKISSKDLNKLEEQQFLDYPIKR